MHGGADHSDAVGSGVEIGQGMSVREVYRKPGIHEHMYYHWRRGYGGLKSDQVWANKLDHVLIVKWLEKVLISPRLETE